MEENGNEATPLFCFIYGKQHGGVRLSKAKFERVKQLLYEDGHKKTW